VVTLGALILWTGLSGWAQVPPAPAATPVEADAPDEASEAPATEATEGTPLDADEEDPPDLTGREGPEEVIVFSEYMVELARREVIGAAKDAGYTKEIRRKDRTILRHEAVWHGEVVLHDSGLVEVKRQPVQFRPPFRKVTPASWLSCIIVPLCIRPNGQLVSKRRFQRYEADVWGEMEDEVSAFHARISDMGTSRKVELLPGRLERLWEQGIPLEGHETLPTVEARKAALLDFWDSRTDTVWGDEIRRVVAAFVRGVVQFSDHPFTDAEIAEYDQRRRTTRPFLEVPAPPVESL
jgi:hypothetical protein